MTLAAAVNFVLEQETGTVVSGTENGKPWVSRWGIDSRYHPEFTPDQIRNLQRDRAALIIGGSQYWDAVHGSELPDYLQLPMLDAGVNEGPEMAIKCLQRALHVTADGIYGSETAHAVAGATPTILLAAFATQRIRSYAADPGWVANGMGWTNRAVLAALEAV